MVLIVDMLKELFFGAPFPVQGLKLLLLHFLGLFPVFLIDGFLLDSQLFFDFGHLLLNGLFLVLYFSFLFVLMLFPDIILLLLHYSYLLLQ